MNFDRFNVPKIAASK